MTSPELLRRMAKVRLGALDNERAILAERLEAIDDERNELQVLLARPDEPRPHPEPSKMGEIR